MSYDTVILSSWGVFLVVWGLSAFAVKRDLRGGGLAAVWLTLWPLRLVVGLFLVIAALRIAVRAGSGGGRGPGFFATRASLFHPPLWLGWSAAVCVAIGVAFAVWARLVLGRNWSPTPSVKQQHELVTNGPYEYVRHPIYTGMLLAALGTALTGSMIGVGIFALASVVFLRRVGREEEIMLGLFPSEYPAYQARTKRLIPFVW